MMELTLRFEWGLTIIIWTRWKRVAIVTPFRNTIELSLDEFAQAVKLARKGVRAPARA